MTEKIRSLTSATISRLERHFIRQVSGAKRSGRIAPDYAKLLAVHLSLGLIFMGCASTKQTDLDLGVLKCIPWTDDENARAGIGQPPKPRPDRVDIRIVIHRMMAHIDMEVRKHAQKPDHATAWMIAPQDQAVKMKLADVYLDLDYDLIEFWTPEMIGTFFSKDGDATGKVNQIWDEAFFPPDNANTDQKAWTGPGIRLVLVKGEDCSYLPGYLRPDGLVRDSILSPQTSTPWTVQFFSNINRLFASANPHALHVFLWWSLEERDIDDFDDVQKVPAPLGSLVSGYSRSAARGGPAVWLGTYTCLSHPLLPDKQCRTLDFYLNRCAKVVAHEIGHALSLHHVEGPFIDYLMYWDPADNYISKDDKGVNLSFQQKQAIVREAREQFSSR